MALFEKGNNIGNRFTSENQPKKNGRKPSMYKQLKELTGKKVDYELSKEDYYKTIRFLLERSSPPDTLAFISPSIGWAALPKILSNIISTVEVRPKRISVKIALIILHTQIGVVLSSLFASAMILFSSPLERSRRNRIVL